MSDQGTQADSKKLEYLAIFAVIVFAGVMGYAIHVSSQAAAKVSKNHYELSQTQQETVQPPAGEGEAQQKRQGQTQ